MASTPVVVRQLLENLIVGVTGITPEEDPNNFRICREYVLSEYKKLKYGRTNHFEVNRRMAELEERFRIVCRDHIADALRSRMAELKALNYKWSAEALDLILHLAWKPVEHARLSDLKAIQPPEPSKQLTWADIVGDEPLEGGDIWDPIDLGNDSDLSSLDDESPTGVNDQDQMANITIRQKKPSDEKEEDKIPPLECFTIPVDWSHLQHLKGAQYWYVPERVVSGQVDASLSLGKVDDLWLVSELHAVRETLFMLGGFPCSLYEVGRRILTEGKDPIVVWIDTYKLKKKFALRHSSREAFISVLSWFAGRGTALNRIREFIKRKEEIPSRQSFLAAITESLAMLNRTLAQFQSTYVAIQGEGQVVSLLQLQQSLESELRPYMTLSAIITSLSKSSFASSEHSSEHLDLLFNNACLLQSIGDIKAFESIAQIFFRCLQIYLRPIREWMEFGQLDPQDTTFFVIKGVMARDDEDEGALGSLWHDQYTLLRDGNGNLKAPRFVLTAANTIFTTGKSVFFLKRLINYETPPSATAGVKPELDFITLYPQGCSEDGDLAPFDELFASAFSAWTREKHHSVSNKLRDVLFTNCGLWKTLAALEHIYFGADGAQFNALATAVFEKQDSSEGGITGKQAAKGRIRKTKDRTGLWNDRFVLTELVQSVFSIWDFVDVKRLGVRRVALPEITTSQAGDISKNNLRSVRQLAGIAIEYSVPWPLLNILHHASLSVYKDVFTLLLQLRRGKYVLERLGISESGAPVATRGSRRGGVETAYLYLRHRLLWFTNAFMTYVTYHVLKPRMERMAIAMRKAEDVDEMIRVHEAFVEGVRDETLLGKNLSSLHDAILTLLDIGVTFADFHTAYLAAITTAPSATSPTNRRSNPYDSDSDNDPYPHQTGGVPLYPTFPTLAPPLPSTAMPPPPLPSRHRRKRPRRYSTAPSIPSSSEDEQSEILDDQDTDMESVSGITPPKTREHLDEEHEQRLGELVKEVNGLLGFLRNGLRGVSRAGVMPHLEILAEGLEGPGGGGGGGFRVGGWGGAYE